LLLSLYDHTILTRLSSCFGFQFNGTVINSTVFFHRTSRHAPSVLNVAALSLLHKHGVPQGSVLGPLLFIMYTTPQLVTLARSLTKSQHFLNPAILLFVHFVVSVRTLIKKTASTIATLIVHSKLDYCNSFIIIFLTPNYTDSS